MLNWVRKVAFPGPCIQKRSPIQKKVQINLDLGEIWSRRHLHGEGASQLNPSDLIFLFFNRHLYGKVNNSDTVTVYKTDHSMISLRLGLTENPRGPGLWKLNTSFLTEEEYINRIKTVILKTREDYKDDNDVKESSTFLWKKKATASRTDETKHQDKIT